MCIYIYILNIHRAHKYIVQIYIFFMYLCKIIYLYIILDAINQFDSTN